MVNERANLRISVAALAVVIFVAVALYPVSMGPMYWLCRDTRGELSGPPGCAFRLAYHPLVIVVQEGPHPFQSVLRSYLRLWEW